MNEKQEKQEEQKKREKQVLEILTGVGAIITDSHIVYTSGRHGLAYVNKDAVYPDTSIISDLCAEIATEFEDEEIDVIIAPAIGGVILSQWTAYWMSAFKGETIHAVYAEKDPDGTFVIKRGYDKYIKGKRVLVVEDILTTGGSAKNVIEAVRAIGGEVVGLGVLCNRGGIVPADVGNVPKLFALTNIKLESWDEVGCPLCSQGVPINTDVGKGREFLTRKAKEQAGAQELAALFSHNVQDQTNK
ncbi:MAG: phosphoribosyltransferase family protein [Candidatus Paceibacterota bacterium]|jgi:orotate phosphoribosyltransferase